MRSLGLYLAASALGVAWLQSGSVSTIDNSSSLRSFYRTKARAVLCETPFQIRKAVVAMAKDDGLWIMKLGCMRPGADKRVRLISAPVTRYGPWLVNFVAPQSTNVSMWGYADAFEPDED